MKIWTCGRSPRIGYWNAWTRIKNLNGAFLLIKFWNFFGVIEMISSNFCWPWPKPGYITVTRRQSNNQWNSGIAAHPAPKISSAKIRWKISRLDFLESRRHSPHLLSSKGPNYQRGLLILPADTIEGLFERKTARKFTKFVLFLHENAQAHRALATQKKQTYLGFHFLDHLPYSPDLVPSDYHLFSGLKTIIESSPFFIRRGGHCCSGDLVGRTTFWIFVLSGLHKL